MAAPWPEWSNGSQSGQNPRGFFQHIWSRQMRATIVWTEWQSRSFSKSINKGALSFLRHCFCGGEITKVGHVLPGQTKKTHREKPRDAKSADV
jgi:hypothetical protein